MIEKGMTFSDLQHKTKAKEKKTMLRMDFEYLECRICHKWFKVYERFESRCRKCKRLIESGKIRQALRLD